MMRRGEKRGWRRIGGRKEGMWRHPMRKKKKLKKGRTLGGKRGHQEGRRADRSRWRMHPRTQRQAGKRRRRRRRRGGGGGGVRGEVD